AEFFWSFRKSFCRLFRSSAEFFWSFRKSFCSLSISSLRFFSSSLRFFSSSAASLLRFFSSSAASFAFFISMSIRSDSFFLFASSFELPFEFEFLPFQCGAGGGVRSVQDSAYVLTRSSTIGVSALLIELYVDVKPASYTLYQPSKSPARGAIRSAENFQL